MRPSRSKDPTRARAVPEGLPLPPERVTDRRCEVLVVGAGAAGSFAALAARGALAADGGALPVPAGAPRVVLLNNEPRLGLKLLVSGGGRCNLTNAQVDERDYDTDAPHLVRRLLRGFPAAAARAFYESRGCPCYTEPLGKVFPRSDDARQVLRTLLDALVAAGVPLVAPAEVTRIERGPAGWLAHTAAGTWEAPRLVLATGGKSLPKTGSRGFGLDALASLGHELAPAYPALTPLRCQGPLSGLAGLTVPAVLTLAPTGTPFDQLAGKKLKPLARAGGSLLVTHHGATGPAPFDVSGACGRALGAGQAVTLRADFWSLTDPAGPWAPFRELDKQPGASLRPAEVPRPPNREAFAAQVAPLLRERERGIAQVLSARLPRRLARALLEQVGIDPATPVKQLDTRARARLPEALTQADLGLTGCEGYAKAEVTAGGILLAELTPGLESKRHPGLFCCGEVVNVTGRLGGFNFQWAWSSGYAAGLAAARSAGGGAGEA